MALSSERDEDEHHFRRLGLAVAEALKHASMLFVIWLIVLVGKYAMEGKDPSKVLNRTGRLLMFMAVFVLIDVVILTYWPKMSQNFVQAGLYYISTILFSCLKV